jgi:hypothetical protein
MQDILLNPFKMNNILFRLLIKEADYLGNPDFYNHWENVKLSFDEAIKKLSQKRKDYPFNQYMIEPIQ